MGDADSRIERWTGAHRHAHLTPELVTAIGRPPEVQVLSVVAVEFRRGEGCCEKDPVRLVTAYYSMDGVLLAESEPVL